MSLLITRQKFLNRKKYLLYIFRIKMVHNFTLIFFQVFLQHLVIFPLHLQDLKFYAPFKKLGLARSQRMFAKKQR